ncbi:hypothetical protein ACP70R_019338 [Stipagrostis hirtigluma subsp. patula]
MAGNEPSTSRASGRRLDSRRPPRGPKKRVKLEPLLEAGLFHFKRRDNGRFFQGRTYHVGAPPLLNVPERSPAGAHARMRAEEFALNPPTPVPKRMGGEGKGHPEVAFEARTAEDTAVVSPPPASTGEGATGQQEAFLAAEPSPSAAAQAEKAPVQCAPPSQEAARTGQEAGLLARGEAANGGRSGGGSPGPASGGRRDKDISFLVAPPAASAGMSTPPPLSAADHSASSPARKEAQGHRSNGGQHPPASWCFQRHDQARQHPLPPRPPPGLCFGWSRLAPPLLSSRTDNFSYVQAKKLPASPGSFASKRHCSSKNGDVLGHAGSRRERQVAAATVSADSTR